MSKKGLFTARTLLVAGALVVAACGGRQSADRAAVEYKGTDPKTPSASAAPSTRSGTGTAGGIASYDGYQAAVARDGDTVASVANRIGLSATELGAYNGLPADHRLRAGDELVLPPRPGGYGVGTAQTVAEAPPADSAGTGAFGTGGFGTDMQVAQAAPGTAGAGAIESAPIETAPTGESAPASTSGWSLAVAAAAIERAQGFDDSGEPGAPPSADEPLPPDPQPPAELASPQLGQYQTPAVRTAPEPPAPRPVETITTPAEQTVEEPVEEAVEAPAEQPVEQPARQTRVASTAPAAELSLIRPARGPIVVGFGQGSGRARNDGIDFASPVGSPVIAAADGEVALVSQSLGGLGTIVLVRHQGEYLTVYGRIDQVQVRKGDLVSRGQQIGVVASNPQPRMHFEVRKGAESLDPERFFRGRS